MDTLNQIHFIDINVSLFYFSIQDYYFLLNSLLTFYVIKYYFTYLIIKHTIIDYMHVSGIAYDRRNHLHVLNSFSHDSLS